MEQGRLWHLPLKCGALLFPSPRDDKLRGFVSQLVAAYRKKAETEMLMVDWFGNFQPGLLYETSLL